MKILGLDCGNEYTGWCVVDSEKGIIDKGKTENNELIKMMLVGKIRADLCYSEMIASYGMAVGQTTFDTCVWIGRFQEMLWFKDVLTEFVYRKTVCGHICGSARAKDSNIRQAMIDRWGEPNIKVQDGVKKSGKNKGEPKYKNIPGATHGFSKDMWSALAVASYGLDIEMMKFKS